MAPDAHDDPHFISLCNEHGIQGTAAVALCGVFWNRALVTFEQSTPPVVHLAPARARRIYIAGPMTGLPGYNFPAFDAKASELRAEGWHVECPADHGLVEGATWADYLHYDLGRLATCGTIHLLPGWSKSMGVKLELYIAKTLGMAIQLASGAEPLSCGVMSDDEARRILKKHAQVYGDARYEPARWIVDALQEAAAGAVMTKGGAA